MQYRFFDVDANQWVQIPQETWQWSVQNTDGTTLHQFDPQTQLFHQFREIDQSKLHVFQMVNKDTNEKYSVLFDPASMKLIHFYRNFMLENDTVRIRAYCFGYERYGQKVIFAIFPSGEVIITDDIEKIGVE
jgi:agmatine/peptidylarginine deiminase